MRLWIGLSLWILAILVPLAWIGRYSPIYKRSIDPLFRPEWVHVALHLLIYAGLVILLSKTLESQGRRLSIAGVVGVILAVGIGQELLQYITSVEWISTEAAFRRSAFDLVVDLAGGLIGFGLARQIHRLGLNSD